MKRLLLLLLCLALLLCAGCQTNQPTTTPGQTAAPTAKPVKKTEYVVDVSLGMEGQSIDPTYVSDADTASYVQHLFEGLMKYVPENEKQAGTVTEVKLDYGMAESCDVSEDGLTYTFHLREAFWRDSQPVTAGDFVYAWQRLVDPSNVERPANRKVLNGIVKNAAEIVSGQADVSTLGVRAADDFTFVVELERNCPYFLKLCASPCLVPLRQDVIETHGGNWTDSGTIVVNGPYTIAEWVHDDFLEMEQNEYYYNRSALGPDRIVWHFSDSEQSALEEFQAGAYDFIGTVPSESLKSLQSENICQTAARSGTYYLYFNVNSFSDWRVRAAMLLSVDRDAIADSLSGEGTAATGFVAAGIQDSEYAPFAAESHGESVFYQALQSLYPDADLKTYEGRCALAQQLYQQAVDEGAWDGKNAGSYCYNRSTLNESVAKACQKNWADVLNLNIRLEGMSREQYSKELKAGNFGVAYLSWMPDYNDAQNFLDLMKTGSKYNHGAWSDPAYDELLLQISALPDGTERDKLLHQAEELLFSDEGFPICPIFFYGESYCMSKKLQGVGYNPFGAYSFQYAVK